MGPGNKGLAFAQLEFSQGLFLVRSLNSQCHILGYSLLATSYPEVAK